jgi:hypothetical protein
MNTLVSPLLRRAFRSPRVASQPLHIVYSPFLMCLEFWISFQCSFAIYTRLVGILAREKLEDFFQSQVFLQLNVKVDKDWRRRDDRLKEYGYLKSK